MVRKKLYIVLSAFAVAASAIMEYGYVSTEDTGYAGVLAFFYKLWRSFQGDVLVGTVLFMAAAAALWWGYDKVKDKKCVGMRLLSAFFAVMMAVGLSMEKTDSFGLLYNGSEQVAKTAVLLAGSYLFYINAMAMLYCFIRKGRKKAGGIGTAFFQERFFFRPFVLLLAVWLPQVCLKYPGAMCCDSYNQLYQYFGAKQFTSHHPPFHTFIIGLFVQAGKCMGSADAGLFFFVLVQTVFFVAVLSYTFVRLEEWKASGLCRTVILAIYCIVPYYSGYAGIVVKDTLYGASFLLYFLCLLGLIREGGEYLKKKGNCALFAAAATLVTLFRNNGIYVVLPMALVLAVYAAKRCAKSKRAMATAAVVLLLPVALYYVINGVLFAAFDIHKGSKREMLSIPFQQTARYVRDYKDEVTEKERAAIDAVLGYGEIGQNYDPRISDPVKATFKDQATSEELKEYFSVWLLQFTKHPMVYVEATCNSIYGLFCPNVDNYVYYANAQDCAKEGAVIAFHTPAPLKNIQDGMVLWYQLLHDIPVVSLFSNVGFYVVIFLFLFVFMVMDKRHRELLLFIPGMLSLAICIASPVVIGHPRYMFPIIYTVPALFAYYVSTGKDEKGE